jgi:hypothetical protein
VVKRLREKPEYFAFTAKDENGKVVELPYERIVGPTMTVSEKGEFALPFVMILPLAREVTFK